jgi:hypothetical protein
MQLDLKDVGAAFVLKFPVHFEPSFSV